MLDVADLDGDINPRRLIFIAGSRFHVFDVGIDIGDLRADRGQHALPILNLHRQLYGVRSRRVGAGTLVPLDFDLPLRVVKQVDDVRTGGGVDRYAFAARDVADDLLAADRIAALRPEHQHVIGATDLDFLLARSECAFDDGGHDAVGRLFAQTLGRDDFAEQLLRRERAVANEREQVVGGFHAGVGERL